MLNYDNDDIEFEDKSTENFRRQLALEQIEEFELAIEQDEHSIGYGIVPMSGRKIVTMFCI